MKLLRNPLVSLDHLVGGPLNQFVAQTIIESLDDERANKFNSSTSSEYLCQGHPIRIDQISHGWRIMKGVVTLLEEDIGVVIKSNDSVAELNREVSVLKQLKGNGSLAPSFLDAAHSEWISETLFGDEIIRAGLDPLLLECLNDRVSLDNRPTTHRIVDVAPLPSDCVL
jgi:hypothetical protein